MNLIFAGPVFTKEDVPALALAATAALIVVGLALWLLLWGLAGFKSKDTKVRSKRIKYLLVGIVLLLFLQRQANLFGWLIY